MSNKDLNNNQGHWVLAKMGKKVLRPGGIELTHKLIKYLNIQPDDDVVEFAPGLGFTANLTLDKNPKSYTGVEINEEAARRLKAQLTKENCNIIVGNASDSSLQEESYSKVYGEAMLTMHADSRKSKIIGEAHRVLKKGGLYGIHELGLKPENISEETKNQIQKELAQVIHVNARPLTMVEWSQLLEAEGFHVKQKAKNAMHLLEKKRIIQDEGLLGTLKIAYNVLTHPKERKQILAMRKVFRKYKDNLLAIAIVAEKR